MQMIKISEKGFRTFTYMGFSVIFSFFHSILRGGFELFQINQRNYFDLIAAEVALAFLHHLFATFLIYFNKHKSARNAND